MEQKSGATSVLGIHLVSITNIVRITIIRRHLPRFPNKIVIEGYRKTFLQVSDKTNLPKLIKEMPQQNDQSCSSKLLGDDWQPKQSR